VTNASTSAATTRRGGLPTAVKNTFRSYATATTVFGRDREAQKPLFWLWINRGTIQEFDPEGPPPVPPAPDARTGSR